MMAFNGVRSSWLILARNSLFDRLAISASFFASISSVSRCFWSVTSWIAPMIWIA